jgi:hypothetical protein
MGDLNISFVGRSISVVCSCAKEYQKQLVPFLFIVESDLFVEQKTYQLRFYPDNFLHLTGLRTKLSPMDFWSKALSGALTESDLDSEQFKNHEFKGSLRTKIQSLPYLASLFDYDILFEEDFIKNRVVCKLATSDGKITLGFDGGKRLTPKSLMKGNLLGEKAIHGCKVQKIKM